MIPTTTLPNQRFRYVSASHILLMAVLYIAFCSAQNAYSAQATFSWLPNSESNLSGYRIHYGTSPGNYTQVVDVGNPGVGTDGRVTAELFNLAENQNYYAAATAYDTNLNESGFSTEVQFILTTTANSSSVPSTSLSSILEAGEVSIDHNWRRINFATPFIDPVIVTRIVTYNGADPSVVRLTNIDKNGFGIRLQEYNYLDGGHTKEVVSYLVMERGSHTLPNGTRIEAGTFNTSATSYFVEKKFNRQFNATPVVITSVASFNGGDTVTGRIRNTDKYKFQYHMQEQESYEPSHTQEIISYIAWERSDGVVGGITYAVGSVGQNVTNSPYSGYYRAQNRPKFTTSPIMVADILTSKGGDTAALRVMKNTTSGFTAKIEEEQSLDTETTHVAEDVGYIAIEAQ